MHTAELRFDYDETRIAELVASAVEQELGETDGERASATLSHEGSRLTVGIDAADLVALRAGLNTWETLVEVAERTIRAGA